MKTPFITALLAAAVYSVDIQKSRSQYLADQAAAAAAAQEQELLVAEPEVLVAEPVAVLGTKPAVQSGEVFYEGEDPYVEDEPTPNVTSDDVHHDHGHVHVHYSEESYHSPEPVYVSLSSESDHYHAPTPAPVHVHHDDHGHGHGHGEPVLHAHGDLVHSHAGGDQYHKHQVEELEEEVVVIKTPVEKTPYEAEVVQEVVVV